MLFFVSGRFVRLLLNHHALQLFKAPAYRYMQRLFICLFLTILF